MTERRVRRQTVQANMQVLGRNLQGLVTRIIC